MLVYLACVYGFALGVHPMGRDYAAMGSLGDGMTWLVQVVFRVELRTFGAYPCPYHLLNLSLLYACMVCIYRLTNLVTGGIWWMGTLAACLFMANPVHTEALLNLSGVAELFPCLAALVALAAYAEAVLVRKVWKFPPAFALYLFAVCAFRENAFLVLVVALFEWLIPPRERRSLRRFGVAMLVGVIGLALQHFSSPPSIAYDSSRFAPLFFLFYPFGYLPETALYFEMYPWLGWFAAGVVLVLLVLMYRKARKPAILFGLLSMAAARLHPDTRAIDPVHLIGGGQLLTANAFYAIALIALFLRIMDHRKWQIPMVSLTTLLSAGMFILQAQANWQWSKAGAEVAKFQDAVKTSVATNPNRLIGVLPDYQYVNGAPLELSQSVSFDTPFSRRIQVASLLPISLRRIDACTTATGAWSEAAGRITTKFAISADVLYLVPGKDVAGIARGAELTSELLKGTVPNASRTTVRMVVPDISEVVKKGTTADVLGHWLGIGKTAAPVSIEFEIGGGRLPTLLIPGASPVEPATKSSGVSNGVSR